MVKVCAMPSALQPPVQPRVGGLVWGGSAAGGDAAVQPKKPVTVPAPSAACGHAMTLGWHPKLGGQPPTGRQALPTIVQQFAWVTKGWQSGPLVIWVAGAAASRVQVKVNGMAGWTAATEPVPAAPAAAPGLICALARTQT